MLSKLISTFFNSEATVRKNFSKHKIYKKFRGKLNFIIFLIYLELIEAKEQLPYFFGAERRTLPRA